MRVSTPFHERIVCCYLYPITLDGYPPDADRTVAHIRKMADLGFQSVELEGIHAAHLTAVYDRRLRILDALKATRLSVPFFCVVLPGLASTEAEVRRANLRLFERGCELAVLLGAKGVLDNAPLPPWRFPEEMPVVRHYDRHALAGATLPRPVDWSGFWRNLTATYREACDLAAAHGLTYHLHPAFGTLASTTDAFLYFRDAVDRDNLRFTIDTANQFFLKDPLVLTIHRLNGLVDYIHLSDNRGFQMEHLEPGKGQIAWDAFFEALSDVGYRGHFGIDIGGAESGALDLDHVYRHTAGWLQERVFGCSAGPPPHMTGRRRLS